MSRHETKKGPLTSKELKLSDEARRKIMAHLQESDEYSGLLGPWQRGHATLHEMPMPADSRRLAGTGRECRGDPEGDRQETALVFQAFPPWLFPALGYVFAFLLMFAAIAHWEPYISDNKTNTEAVLLSNLPQGEQPFFTKEPPEINRLFAAQ